MVLNFNNGQIGKFLINILLLKWEKCVFFILQPTRLVPNACEDPSPGVVHPVGPSPGVLSPSGADAPSASVHDRPPALDASDDSRAGAPPVLPSAASKPPRFPPCSDIVLGWLCHPAMC